MAAAAAAASLSGMSMNPWAHHHSQQQQQPLGANGYRTDPRLDDPQGMIGQPYQQPLLPQEYYENGE